MIIGRQNSVHCLNNLVSVAVGLVLAPLLDPVRRLEVVLTLGFPLRIQPVVSVLGRPLRWLVIAVDLPGSWPAVVPTTLGCLRAVVPYNAMVLSVVVTSSLLAGEFLVSGWLTLPFSPNLQLC